MSLVVRLLFVFLFVSPFAFAKEYPKPPKDLTVTSQCVSYLASFKTQFPFMDYGWIPVSQDKRTENQIYIFYQSSINRSEDGSIKNPVVFFNGGPSANSHNYLDKLMKNQELKETTSFFILDQRGTGCSSGYPNNPKLEELPLYGSAMIVEDAEALRAYFNISKWTAFGHSYGGFVAQRYLEAHPESLNNAVMYGTELGSVQLEGIFNRFEKGLSNLEQFFVQYPKLEITLKEIADSIPEDFCIEAPNYYKICGKTLMDLHVIFVRDLDLEEVQTRFLQWITYYKKLMDSGKKMDAPEIQSYWTTLAAHMMGKSHARYYWEQVITKQEITPGYTDAESAVLFQNDENALISEARLMRSLEFLETSFQQVSPSPVMIENLKTNLSKNPQVNFYIFNGELDVYTPIENVRKVYEQSLVLENVHFMTFPNAGHQDYLQEPVIKALQK